MKTKQVKIRKEEIKQGVVAYRAHPEFGIERFTFLGRPFKSKFTNSLFAPVNIEYLVDGEWYKTGRDEVSLCDAGITALYNDKRTFRKLKHALRWKEMWAKSLGFQERHTRFEEMRADFYLDDDLWDYTRDE